MDDHQQFQLAKYTVVERIGRGGMSEVYKGIAKDSDQVVAIKIMRAALKSDDINILRFKREAEMLNQLSHPHIVEIYEFNQMADKTYYLVLEFIDGPTLKETLRELLAKNELMSLEQLRTLVNQVGSALRIAHALGIVHRDIKPDNIMLRTDESAVLTDFGLAKVVRALNSTQLTVTGTLIGTPAYMSPEQALGSESDVRGDIYSLGIVLFQLTTGQLPFNGESFTSLLLKVVNDPPPRPSDINPHISKDLEEIILKSLEKSPENRYQSIDELLADINTSGTDPAIINMMTRTDAEKLQSILEQQMLVPSLLSAPFQFPPLPANFVGRHDEIEELVRLLVEEREPLVGLVGFAGVGKSAVVTLVAHQIRNEFPDGILWAQLDTTTVEDELRNFAAAFGHTDEIGQLSDLPSKAKYVRGLLADKKVLVVLDHAESNDQIRYLQPNGPYNQTLITSRNGRLLHNLGVKTIPIEVFSEQEGLVYLERILGEHRVQKNLKQAKEIIDLVGGLPLALSIVAGSLISSIDFSLSDYVELLQDEQERLATLRDWEDSSRDVAASFELSYRTLEERQRVIFATLGVFDGPDFDSQAVANLVDVSLPATRQVLNNLYLLSLLSAGLGKRDGYFPIDSDGNGRYQLNPLLKTFARQKLGADLEKLQIRAAAYYTALAEKNRHPDHYQKLDLDWPNICVAVSWAYERGQTDLVIRAALALTHNHTGTFGYFDRYGQYTDARRLLGWALDLTTAETRPLVKANLLTNAAGFAVRQADLESAEVYLRQSADLLEREPPSPELTLQQVYLSTVYAQLFMNSDMTEALFWVEKGLELAGEISETAENEQGALFVTKSSILARSGRYEAAIVAAETGLKHLSAEPSSARAIALRNMASLTYLVKNYDAEGDAYIEQGVQIAQQMKDARAVASLKNNLAVSLQQRGAYRRAKEILDEVLPLYEFLGSAYYHAVVANTLGQILTRLGEWAEAERFLEEAIELNMQKGLLNSEPYPRLSLADLYLRQRRPVETLAQLERVEELMTRTTLGIALQARLWRYKGQLAMLNLNIPEAQTALEKALELAKGDVLESGRCWHIQGELREQQGDFQAAKQAYIKSLDYLEAVLAPHEQAEVKLSLAGCLLATRADQSEIQVLLDEVAESAHRMGANPLIEMVANLGVS